MSTLFIFNHSPFNDESAWHGLRLAVTLAKRDAPALRLFLFADGVELLNPESAGEFAAHDLAASLHAHDVRIGACGSCLDAHGLGDAALPANAARANLNDAADWTAQADKVLVY